MENKAHALVAGLFLLLLGTALAASLIWFRGDHVQRLPYTVVTHASVPGLNVKAAVKLRGVDVGSVESITFDPGDPRRILVRIAVDSAAPLTRSTYAQLGYQGVTGLSFIELGDKGGDTKRLAELADGERRIPMVPSLLDQLATSGPALLGAVAETAERVSALLSPQNQDRLARLLDSGERAADRIAARADELRPAVAAVRPAIGQLEEATRRAQATLSRLENTADQASLLASDLRGRLGVLDRAGEAAARVESAVRSFELGVVGPGASSLPPSPPLLETLGRAARAVDLASAQLAEQPQSLIFGRTPAAPGPGEAGFDASARGAR